MVRKLPAACQDDAVAVVVPEKLKRFTNPRIETGRDVPRDLADDVFAVLEPLEFDARRRGPDRFFAFFAVVTVTHRTRVR